MTSIKSSLPGSASRAFFAISLPGRLEQSARELAVVMDAIERRDAELAAQSLTIYVRNAGEAALKRLDSARDVSPGQPEK